MFIEAKETKEIKEKLNLGNINIGFIGPEGVGKTTIAKMVGEITGKATFSTGDIIRDLAKNDPSETGDKCRKILSDHVYLDGKTLLELVKKRLENPDTEKGFIIDGGFRTVEEIKGLPKILEETGKNGSIILFYLQASNETCIKRLLTGSRHREDDTTEGISKRHSEFYKNLDDRISTIQSQKGWTIVDIDADRPIEEVCESVMSILKFLIS